jgi:hypothetical protein
MLVFVAQKKQQAGPSCATIFEQLEQQVVATHALIAYSVRVVMVAIALRRLCLDKLLDLDDLQAPLSASMIVDMSCGTRRCISNNILVIFFLLSI